MATGVLPPPRVASNSSRSCWRSPAPGAASSLAMNPREASSANRLASGAPRNSPSPRPLSSASAWFTSWMAPWRSHTTRMSDIEVSTLKRNFCVSSRAAFFSSSATSYCSRSL
jgi:hypothetical protein